MKIKILVFFLLSLAFILRVWGLNNVPPELFGDELDVGYHSYSILETGRDYYSQFMPLYFHSFAEWRAPLLMYLTVPSIALFGLDEWGVRLPEAFLGTISVLILYLLVKKATKKEFIALLSAFFLATSPWHIQYSRAAFELSPLLFLFLLGTYFIFLSFEKKWFLVPSAITLGLTLYTYSTANLFLPLLLFVLIIAFKKSLVKTDGKVLGLSLVLLFLVALPIGKEILFGHAAERFTSFSFFNHKEFQDAIINRRNAAGNDIFERMVNNKPLSWIRVISLNYLSAFSPQFLLERGDVTFRHSIHEMGEIYWFQLPLLLLGIFWLLTRESKPTRNFWLGWLLIAPIPTSLTWDGAYHASRLFVMLPPLMVISSFGLFGLWETTKNVRIRNILVFVLSFWFLINFATYLHRYYVHYPIESWRWWHYGYKESMQTVCQEQDKYKVVALNNTYEPSLIRFLFWCQYPPSKFQQEFKVDKNQKNILPGFDGFSVGEKFYFGQVNKETDGVIKFLKPDMLYLISQQDEVGGGWDWEKSPPEGVKVIKTIRNFYKDPIFYVATKKN